MQRFIPMGIIEHRYELHRWMMLRDKVSKPESKLRVLNMYDLAFGFYIWLAACNVSVVGFILELMIHKFWVFKNLYVNLSYKEG